MLEAMARKETSLPQPERSQVRQAGLGAGDSA